MVALARPLTSTMAGVVELHCPGRIARGRLAGEPCERLLGTAQQVGVTYSVTLACPRCTTRTTFEVTGG
jgi:hypothetical protein